MIVSIDIGSTWTKGAAFRLSSEGLELVARERVPTSVEDLSGAFLAVVDALSERTAVASDDFEIFYSSSAKGGLAVSALGLVPDLTSEIARLAAFSAGARLTSVYSYLLTEADIAELEQCPPDILLFSGGTDGGNTDFVLKNARALAASQLDCDIIYAGNRDVRKQVAEILGAKELTLVDNLLPEIDSPQPEPVRGAIRAIFLNRIVRGKGLDKIVANTGVEPLPTPYALYEFVQAIHRHVPGWDEFVLVDLGGATTDVYSIYEPRPDAATVIRGVPEPRFKRSVEGDLGMRVSASAAQQACRELLGPVSEQGQADSFADYIALLGQQTAFLPQTLEQSGYDQMLAGASVATALARHTGRIHQVFTVDGPVNVQIGRDLRQVTRMIGSGGYLANAEDFVPQEWLTKMPVDNQGKQVLSPGRIEYYRDTDYLFPLLANIAQSYPEAAAKSAIRGLGLNSASEPSRRLAG